MYHEQIDSPAGIFTPSAITDSPHRTKVSYYSLFSTLFILHTNFTLVKQSL